MVILGGTIAFPPPYAACPCEFGASLPLLTLTLGGHCSPVRWNDLLVNGLM